MMSAKSDPEELEVARFSPDGETILTGGWDKAVRLWPMPKSLSGSTESIKTWVETTTRLELEASGNFRVLDSGEWRLRHDLLVSLGNPLQ